MPTHSSVRRFALAIATLSIVWLGDAGNSLSQPATSSFTIEQILNLPTPDNLTASPVGSTIAWSFNQRGVRNIYTAEAPDFGARCVTPYTQDDGQELTKVSFSPDGTTLVYVRGGDHGSNRPGEPPNPAGDPTQPKTQVWSLPAFGGTPKALGEGDDPVVTPDGKQVAFVKDRRVWMVPIDGSKAPEIAFAARGAIETPVWSPEGRTLAFVSNRGDHSFIGLFTPGQPIRYIAPSTSRDSSPVWSEDGRKIAFVRQPGAGGAPKSPLIQDFPSWAIVVADVPVRELDGDELTGLTAVTSGDSPTDPILQHPGGMGLHWAADDTLIFLSYRDGWPHLYSVQHPGTGRPALLTPGPSMVESFTLTPDRRTVIYSANAGPDRNDVDRRHLFSVSITGGTPRPLTSGEGIEWSPVVLAGGQGVAFLSSETRRPPLPATVSLSDGQLRLIGTEHLPGDFPGSRLVAPEQVIVRAMDGIESHGQLFKTAEGPARRPAIVYVHGGGPRQMLLGWHTRWEYANDYGINQYLASLGFVVLSINYRLSVGYGQAFQFPDHAGARGASEYKDILAAGRYLQKRPDVDPTRIGIWGASYGGYLTALALGRNSDVFAAGVDIHGVHDRLRPLAPAQFAHALVADGVSDTDLRQALRVEFESSPIAAVPTWTSPVLLIHGDDDRTVDFHQTVDLGRRLSEKGVKVEELVLPDDVHDSLLWRNWRTTAAATAQFFERTLKVTPTTRPAKASSSRVKPPSSKSPKPLVR